MFYASALVLGAICIWSFSRLHPFFSSNCDWDMVLYLKSHYAGYYDATTLHVAAHTILRIRDFLSLFTSERMSLVVLFGLFHLSSVALSGLLAYRLFNSL
ncbi:MAG: hypothetical protein KDK27_08995, partial [Leptospiraceae bacterium]|nr:hypothetical protein [Leptospiraceae bacterium]